MDILLEKESDADEQESSDDSEWAPRQFICPITQVRDGTAATACCVDMFRSECCGNVKIVARIITSRLSPCHDTPTNA